MGMATEDRFRVVGGAHLRGEVTISGAKNSALKLMAAALLAPGLSTIRNVPEIADVEIMGDLLTRLGCTVTNSAGVVTIDVPQTPGHRADYDLVRKMRASINVLGPLVARTGKAEVALPGGDAIGSRGLDFHIKGLESLGATAHIEHGYVVAQSPHGLKGAAIDLDFPSVGATENIMTAAVLAQGVTTIDNAAREPDLVDLGQFLISMGADIKGLGTPLITITGVSALHPTDHTIDVATLPYPGFPTDLLPMVIALNAIADGSAIVTENVFESRFMFVNELIRLGAQISIDGHHASITGVKELSGAPVEATDIRAGAGLVLAALVSEGETTIDQAFHLDRGYPNFAAQLQSLGAKVTRE